MALSRVASRTIAYTPLVRPLPRATDAVEGASPSPALGDAVRQPGRGAAATERPVANSRGELTGRIINTSA